VDKHFHLNINHVIGGLLVICILLPLLGCGGAPQKVTNLTTTPTTDQETTTAVQEPEPSGADLEREVSVWELDEFLDAWGVLYRSEETIPTCKVTVTNLCTPVVLELVEAEVTGVEVFGRTLEVDGKIDEGYIAFSIGDFTDETLYINGLENSWLVTETETFYYPCEESVYTWFWVSDEGAAEYHKIAAAADYMEQWITAPLDSATDRGNLYEEMGTVEMVNGKPEFTMQERTLMGDVYDLDAIFEEAIAEGLEGYEGCETADDVLARNKEKGTQWLTYPWEG
jgi:hypothetical protein